MGKSDIIIQHRHKYIMPAELPVPERQRKKAERDTRLATALTNARADRRKLVAERKAEWLKRGQNHHSLHLAEQKRLVDQAREAKSKGNLFVPAEPKVLLVVRIKGINKMDPKSRLILRLLRLRQIHNGVFMKVNKATMSMLKRVEPWVTYGYPNRKTIETLVYEIVTCGPAFKEVNNFLWPFKLNPPKGGYASKTKTYLNNGDQGNREAFINEFVRRMC